MVMQAQAKICTLEELRTALSMPTGQFELEVRLGELSLDAIVRLSPQSKGLVCFLSSAQNRSEPPRVPYYPRWSWAAGFPDHDFMVMSDPVLRTAPEVHSSWYLQNDVDVLATMASFIGEFAGARGTPADRIVFYGSSMGGFGAIMLASLLKGSRAVAEVPQIDMRKFPDQDALREVDEMLGDSGALERLSVQFPERTDVLQRIAVERHLPSMMIVTNRADEAFEEQLELFKLSAGLMSELRSIGTVTLQAVARHAGHSVLDRSKMTAILESYIALGDEPVRVRSLPGEQARLPLQAPSTLDQPQLPIDLKNSPTWLPCCAIEAKGFSIKAELNHLGAGGPKALLLALDIEGLTSARVDELGLIVSTYNEIGLFKYVAMSPGANYLDLPFRLEGDERLYGVGFSEWDSGPCTLITCEVEQY